MGWLTDWDGLRAAPLPAAVTIKYAQWVDHWVVVLAITESQVTVGDPIRGRESLPRQDFERKWRGVIVTAGKP